MPVVSEISAINSNNEEGEDLLILIPLLYADMNYCKLWVTYQIGEK